MTVSDALVRAAFDQETGEVVLVALTLEHDDLVQPIRVINNTEAVTVEGEEFVTYPFEISLPDDQDSGPPRARLAIDNVSREIAQSVREIASPVSVTIAVVRAVEGTDGWTGAVELSFPNFLLRDVKWDALQVSGDLQVEDLTREPYPAGSFTPASFPGLF